MSDTTQTQDPKKVAEELENLYYPLVGTAHLHDNPESAKADARLILRAAALIRSLSARVEELEKENAALECDIDDLCTVLCEATGNSMSKPGYELDAMLVRVRDYIQKERDEATAELEKQLDAARADAEKARELAAGLMRYAGPSAPSRYELVPYWAIQNFRALGPSAREFELGIINSYLARAMKGEQP